MRKSTFVALALLFVVACSHRKTLTEQLNAAFTNHLKQIDSAATLDSVHIVWNVAVTRRLGRIIDDSVYVREYTRVKAQLGNAQQRNDKDSIEFFQYEINYMEKEIDSISRGIGQEDTSHRFGTLLSCMYSIKKNNAERTDSTMLFIDSTGTLRYGEFMDSAIARTVREMR